jgi:hypothetical protein
MRHSPEEGGTGAGIRQRAVSRHQRELKARIERVDGHGIHSGLPTLDYLHGMSVESDRRPGAGLTMVLTDQWGLAD